MINNFLAGWASAEITPTIPCRMDGYAMRTALANAIHDPLYAQALALGTESEQLVLIICDLIAVDEAMVQEVRNRALALLPGATIWLGATHTHSGPAAGRLSSFSPGASDPSVVKRIITGVVQAATDAVSHMHPTRLAWARGKINNIATNRDHPDNSDDIFLDLLCFYDVNEQPAVEGRPQGIAPTIDGMIVGQQTSWCSRNDPLRSPSKPSTQPAAILGSFPCHPTVLSAGNLALSADLPGAFRRHLQALPGNNTWIALATGAAGDISTRHMRQGQGFDELDRLGTLLAEQAQVYIHQARPLTIAPLIVRQSVIDFAAKPTPPSELLEQYAHTFQDQMKAEQQAGNIAQARTLETILQGIAAARKFAPEFAGHKLQAEIATATLGELGLAAIPGELYSRLGAEIQRAFNRPLLLLGYTNGYAGYLPTREAYNEIDYEVLISPFAPGSGERLRDTVSAMLAQPPANE